MSGEHWAAFRHPHSAPSCNPAPLLPSPQRSISSIPKRANQLGLLASRADGGGIRFCGSLFRKCILTVNRPKLFRLVQKPGRDNSSSQPELPLLGGKVGITAPKLTQPALSAFVETYFNASPSELSGKAAQVPAAGPFFQKSQ